MSERMSLALVSAIPGRIRVRVGRSFRSLSSMNELAGIIRSLNGVRDVQINPTTGSFLILYDPEAVDIGQLYLAAQAANVDITLPGDRAESTADSKLAGVARAINATFGRVDRTIFDFTGGKLDAKTLAPLAVGGVAVRQLFTQGVGISSIPWYVLLWYSFEMFTKYNYRYHVMPEVPPESPKS